MSRLSDRRKDLASRFRSTARSIMQDHGVNRSSLSLVLSNLLDLAREGEIWNAAEFPEPDPSERQARYLIDVDEDSTYALYLNVMRPGKIIPPHNHTTWACIAAVEGEERNKLYRRLDAGDVPGKADIAEVKEVIVGPGTGIALMPDDIHSVTITGDRLIRHLHMYGRALETLRDRLVFDPDAGTCKLMDIGVKTRTGR